MPATWNISSYYNGSSNQPMRYFSVIITNYDTTGSTESYSMHYQGFDIDFDMVRILSTGYMQCKYTILTLNSEANWNRHIFTYRSYANSYISDELTAIDGHLYEGVYSYTLNTNNYNNPIILGLSFYDYKRMDAYEIGYTNGMDDTEALYSGQNEEFNGTFTLIGDAFNSLAGIMNINVIGGLTIGGLVGIPLTITIMITLFKIMRK